MRPSGSSETLATHPLPAPTVPAYAKEIDMKIAGISVALLVGVSVAIWTSDASAQLPAGYAAAAKKCRAQGRAQYPTARESEGMRNERARAFNACMAGLGYRP
jgi:hypothetical protein